LASTCIIITCCLSVFMKVTFPVRGDCIRSSFNFLKFLPLYTIESNSRVTQITLSHQQVSLCSKLLMVVCHHPFPVTIPLTVRKQKEKKFWYAANSYFTLPVLFWYELHLYLSIHPTCNSVVAMCTPACLYYIWGTSWLQFWIR
jgi:hypothetical protein